MSRYPFTGPNYAQYGEVAGYIYYPWNDQYYIDPQMVQDYNESVGLAEPAPKEPSYMDTIAPIAGTAAALALGTGVGNKIINGDWPSWLKFGDDAAAQVAPQTGQIVGGGVGQSGVTAGLEAGGALGGGSGMVDPSLVSTPIDGSTATQTGTWAANNPMLGGALGAVGLGLGAKGVYDAAEAGDPIMGGISGAGAGLGASMLSQAVGLGALGPWGWGVGAALGIGAGLLGDRETGREQIQNRINALQEQGVNIPQPLLEDLSSYGLSKEDLVAREQAKIAAGQHGNPLFAQSRDEKDLTALDTVGGLMWMETLGNDYWSGFTPEQRVAMNDAALKQGLIEEGRGQLKFRDEAKAKELANQFRGAAVASNASQPQGMIPTNQSTPPAPPPTSSTTAPTPLNAKTLQTEGQKQIELGNMKPAGMIPTTGIGTSNGDSSRPMPKPVEPTVQPQQEGGNMNTPAAIQAFQNSGGYRGLMQQPQQVPIQPVGMIPVPQQTPVYNSLQNGIAGFMGPSAYNAGNAMNSAMQQARPPQQPVGMIPVPVRTNTLSPGIGLDGRPIRY
jgi:hypothetical protein